MSKYSCSGWRWTSKARQAAPVGVQSRAAPQGDGACSLSGFPSDAEASNASTITMPQFLEANYARWPDRVWMRKKDKGIWKEYTWAFCHEQVKYFFMGLMCLGFQRGEKVSIIGDNDPHWFWAELAAHTAGGAIAGIFSSSSPSEIQYIAELSDSTFLIAQDQEQVDKVLAITQELPLVRRVIYWDPKGMRNYDDPVLLSFDEVVNLGLEYAKTHPALFEESVAQGKGDDLALLICTSGTTGRPKLSLVTHELLYNVLMVTLTIYDIYETDDWVSYILPGWLAEQGLGLLPSLLRGFAMNFPESLATVDEDIREVGPQIIFYPSRLWDKMASSIQNSMRESSWIDRLAYKVCMPVGYRKADAAFEGRDLGPFWKVMYRLCRYLLFDPIRDRHGLRRVRSAFTGGALLGPDVFRLITAVGVDLRQTYSCSEMSVSMHTAGNIKPDSVGTILGDKVVRVADNSEILVKGAATTLGYYKNPEATDKAFAGGWFHTGDAGYIDDDGHVYYLDRVEYMRELADGTRYAPQYIESRLKFSPFINDAFAVGDETKSFIGAVVEIDFDNVGNWAEKRKIPYTTFADLSQRPEVCKLVRQEVERVNEALPEQQRVKRVVNAPKPFDPDESELTRTMKLRRGFMEDRYRGLVEALYGEDEEVATQVKVVYRDGRTATVTARLKVIQI